MYIIRKTYCPLSDAPPGKDVLRRNETLEVFATCHYLPLGTLAPATCQTLH
jgi:hypothetical protein